MSIDELRVCMKLQQSNEKNGEEIQAAQDAFKRDQVAVKNEQAEVSKANEGLRTRMAALTAERDSLSAAVTDLNTRIQAAKKEEKAALEPDRAKLNERNKAFEKGLDDFNAEQSRCANGSTSSTPALMASISAATPSMIASSRTSSRSHSGVSNAVIDATAKKTRS